MLETFGDEVNKVWLAQTVGNLLAKGMYVDCIELLNSTLQQALSDVKLDTQKQVCVWEKQRKGVTRSFEEETWDLCFLTFVRILIAATLHLYRLCYLKKILIASCKNLKK